MQLFGVNSFGSSTQQSWQEVTKGWSTMQIQNILGSSVSSYQTTYIVTSSTVIDGDSSRRRRSTRQRRGLQQQDSPSVKVTFTQTISYVTTDLSVTPELLSTFPFETASQRNKYVQHIQDNSDDTALLEVQDTSKVTAAATGPSPQPTAAPSPTTTEKALLSIPAIIGIGCGGAALLLLIILYFVYCRGNKGKKTVTSSTETPMIVSVNKDDEVSTLNDPTVVGNGPQHNGDQRYVIFNTKFFSPVVCVCVCVCLFLIIWPTSNTHHFLGFLLQIKVLPLLTMTIPKHTEVVMELFHQLVVHLDLTISQPWILLMQLQQELLLVPLMMMLPLRHTTKLLGPMPRKKFYMSLLHLAS